MQIANIDPVDIFGLIVLPPFGALVVYGTAYALARGISGGRPLSSLARAIFLYLSIFTLGMGYLIGIFGMFKFPDGGLWVSLAMWGIFVIWLGKRKRRRQREIEDAGLSPRT